MLGSKNNFFTQDSETLKIKRINVSDLLKVKGYKDNQIEVYLKAYDYFVLNSFDYDGATFVKDLCDIPSLDLDAMLHDFQYSVYNVAKSFKTKFISDWIYAKGQEKKGKGSYSSFSRFLALTIILSVFVPYTAYKKRLRYIDNSIYIDYEILIKNK